MKRNVWVFGLIAGCIVSTLMVFSATKCHSDADFENSMFIGYASMLLAFSFIFVGVKNYRDKYSHGLISFGKAFKIGLFITLIASSMYVIVWLVDYYVFIPDFMDKYAAHTLIQAKKSGATSAEILSKTREMADFKEMYQNPILVILFTYSEVLPVGLLVSIISALILKRKLKESN